LSAVAPLVPPLPTRRSSDLVRCTLPRPLGDRLRHLPAARGPDPGTGRRLDAVDRADPARMRHVAIAIAGMQLVEGSPPGTLPRHLLDPLLRPAGVRAGPNPGAKEVG